MNSRSAACLWSAFFAFAAAGGEEMSRPSAKELGAMAAQYYETGARLQDAGSYRDAETQYNRSVETWERAYGPQHPGLIRLLNALAALHLESRQADKAETATRRALDVQQASPGAMPATDEAITFLNLGSVQRTYRKFEESESAYLKAEAILQRAAATDDLVMANVWNNLGALYADWGKADRSASYLERSLTRFGEGCSQQSATTLANLAWVSDQVGRAEAAERAFARSAECARRAFGPAHRQTADALAAYAKFLRTRKRIREAARLEAEAREIRALLASADPSRYVVDARELRAKPR